MVCVRYIIVNTLHKGDNDDDDDDEDNNNNNNNNQGDCWHNGAFGAINTSSLIALAYTL